MSAAKRKTADPVQKTTEEQDEYAAAKMPEMAANKSPKNGNLCRNNAKIPVTVAHRT